MNHRSDVDTAEASAGTWTREAAADSVITGCLEGLLAPWKGFRYMMAHPGLFRYAVIPFFLNLAITIGVLVFLAFGGVELYAYLHDGWGDGWLGGLYAVLLAVLLSGALLIAAFLIWLLLQGVLCDYFYGLLAEQVERSLGLPADRISEVSLRFQVVDAIQDTTWLLLVNLGCLILQIIPIVGTVVGIAGGLYVNFMVLGGDHLGHALALRGWRVHEMREFARRHRPQTLGLGTVAWTMALVPVLGSFMLSTVTAGAVLLQRRLARIDDRKSTEDRSS